MAPQILSIVIFFTVAYVALLVYGAITSRHGTSEIERRRGIEQRRQDEQDETIKRIVAENQ